MAFGKDRVDLELVLRDRDAEFPAERPVHGLGAGQFLEVVRILQLLLRLLHLHDLGRAVGVVDPDVGKIDERPRRARHHLESMGLREEARDFRVYLAAPEQMSLGIGFPKAKRAGSFSTSSGRSVSSARPRQKSGSA
ncbi:hypothetical protein ACVW1A_008296 [Bradyrhizobium sp. LB1.3]